MADKAQNEKDARQIVDTVRWQTNALRYLGSEAATVTLGRIETGVMHRYSQDMRPYAFRSDSDGVTRLLGLEVKIDGDVGVRVG